MEITGGRSIYCGCCRWDRTAQPRTARRSRGDALNVHEPPVGIEVGQQVAETGRGEFPFEQRHDAAKPTRSTAVVTGV